MKNLQLPKMNLFLIALISVSLLTLPISATADHNKKNYKPTITGIVASTEGLESLTAALVQNELAGVFDGKKEYTVFAPTNEAFAALGLTPDSDYTGVPDIVNILTYHAKKGKLSIERVVTADKLKMLNKAYTTTGVGDGGPFIKGNSNTEPSFIVTTLYARNGVVYVIDTVLLP